MAEQALLAPEPDAADHETAPSDQESAGRGSSILSKLYVAVFLVAVVMVECLAAYLYIPSPSETAAMANAASGTGAEGDLPSGIGEQENADLLDQVEVDLGEFTVTAFQPVTETTLRMDFHLYGTIHTDDQMSFDEAWQGNTHRLRDQVIMTVRSCEMSELTDGGLGLIKRKILEKTNRILGKPLLQAVIFSDFSFIEQ